jgi:3D (Asp-Asp-Asp) domain-containing protein
MHICSGTNLLRLVLRVMNKVLRGDHPVTTMTATLLVAAGTLHPWTLPTGSVVLTGLRPGSPPVAVEPLWGEGEELPLSPPRECAPSRARSLRPGVSLLPFDEVGPDFLVTATGYSSTYDQTDSTPFITASNSQVRWGIIALSRDLLREFTPGAPFGYGDRVQIPGVGIFIVEDTMHGRWRGRVDIWFPSRSEAARWGVQHVSLVPA